MKLMKKYVFISMMALVTMVLTGCEKNEPCQFHKVNVDFVVPHNTWTYDSEMGWYSAVYETNALSTYVYDYGTWTMSHEYNPGTADAYLIQLPEILSLPDEDESGNLLGYYYQRIDYEVGVGYVRVYVTNLDYAYLPGWKPEEMYFHMQIVY